MNPSRILTVLTAVAALACLVGAGMWVVHNVGGMDWATTTGRVIGVETRMDRDRGREEYAVVEYDVDGRSYRLTAGTSSDFNFTGSSRTIRYDPDHPTDARIITVRQVALGPFIAALCGLGLFAVFRLRMKTYGLRRRPTEPSTEELR